MLVGVTQVLDIFKPDLEKWRPAGVESEQQRWLEMNESYKNGGQIKSENSLLTFFQSRKQLYNHCQYVSVSQLVCQSKNPLTA